MAKVIMVQGTMSGAGKSMLVAGLCRIMKQDGYKVCPFKSQNMALNSFITKEGLEMGRAQVVQAQAAGIEPSALMNPILLKPNSDTGSQVIVNGKVVGNMHAKDYFAKKTEYISDIMHAYDTLSKQYDVIVIEGAGSPAEINLKENDIVNMGMAKLVDAPVLLVGDIDRGGVFAQLYGTVKLLPKDEQNRIKGLVINKFRGDKSILDSGLNQIEKLTDIPVAGVVPYMQVDIEDEDSLSERLGWANYQRPIHIAVIKLPRMSNYTDFDVLGASEYVNLTYVQSVAQLGNPDLIILPGTKSTISDLKWLRESGLEAMIVRFAKKGGNVIGICGGYQMLGREISDPEQVEDGGTIQGLNLLPVCHVLAGEKHTTQVTGRFEICEGILKSLSGLVFQGYEIHHGEATFDEKVSYMTTFVSGEKEGAFAGSVYGTYVHGIFDAPQIAEELVKALMVEKGLNPDNVELLDRDSYREKQFDLLADTMRSHLDMQYIYKMMDM